MKKLFFGSFITILSVLAILGGIYYYQQIKSPRLKPIQAIPSNAAVVVEVKNVRKSWEKLKETKLWQDASSSGVLKRLNEELIYFDSLIGKSGNLNDLLESENLYISAHPTNTGDFNLLFMAEIPQLNPEDFTNTLVKEVFKDVAIAKRQFQGIEIIEIPINSTNQKQKYLSYSVSKGILVASFTSYLLENTIRKIKKTLSTDSVEQSFTQVYNSSGRNVEANIYVNYKYLPELVKPILKMEKRNAIPGFSDFASWSEFDLRVKTDAISLTGITSTKSVENQYLNVFANQAPQAIKLTSILPYNTAFMVFTGVNNFNTYYSNYKSYLSKLPRNSAQYEIYIKGLEILRNTKKEFETDVELNMLTWIGNEMAMVTLEPTDSTYADNSYAVIAARDIEKAKFQLKQLAGLTNKDSASLYNGYEINQIKIKYLLPSLFGNSFSRIENCFYTAIGNYIVFGNNEAAIHNFLNEVLSQHVLSREAGYNKFAVNISEKANFYVYANISRSTNSIKEYLSDSLVYKIENNIPYFSHFNALGLQYVSNQSINGFYNTFYIQGQEKEVETVSDTKLEWKTELDAPAIGTPQFVINHETGEKEIMVQDDDFNLYLIDKAGEILWKKKLPSKIAGDIFQIDVLKNKRLQYLFNTKAGLHLITREGEYVDKFPIKFASKATNSISVFDYDGKKDYRIFVGCENKKVYAFQANGKPVEGWELNKPVGIITSPIQHFKIDKKDYLVISENKGAVYITDRKGEIKSVADKLIYKSKNNNWEYDYVDQPYFVCTDSSGNIFNLYLNGKTIVEHISNFSPRHYFAFKDMNGDNIKDYIYLDKNYLFVSNQDTSKIFDYTFQDINPGEKKQPASLIFIENNSSPEIAVVSKKSSQIYIFNSDGSLKKDFPVKGSTLFEVVSFSSPNSFQKKPKRHFATGEGKNLYFYSFK